MTDAPAVPTGFRASRFLVGGLVGLLTHAFAFAGGFIAARLVPKPNEGFRDLATVVGVFLLIEVIIGLACLIAGTVAFVKGKRDRGLGLVAGWLIGVVAVWLFLTAQS
ncbi:MAG TPA: hypothetical protein VF163_03050 [Micromonosporaceae bacterium]